MQLRGGSLELFLELLELLLGAFATRSRLLRELFCLGLLHLVQLHHLFLTRWHTITSLSSLADSIWLFSFLKYPCIVVPARKNFEYTGSVEMFKKLERSWGFHPRHFAPPQCDNPREGNNSTIALRRGGPGGQALSPPLKRVSFFCAIVKGILQSQ